MDVDVDKILSAPKRVWAARPGASAEELDALIAAIPCPVSPLLIALLRFSNGGEGDLALPPRFFVLDSVAEILDSLNDRFLTEQFPGFVFFGGNGGLERFALDLNSAVPPFPVVMIDPIAGPESAMQIAPDFSVFVEAIGLEYHDEHDDA